MYALVSTGWGLWKRWSSDMPALVQIWIGPEGARRVNNPTAGAVSAGVFTPWTHVVEVSIEPKGEDTTKFKLVGPTTFWKGKQIMYTEVRYSPKRAEEIRERIAGWRAESSVSASAKLEAGTR